MHLDPVEGQGTVITLETVSEGLADADLATEFDDVVVRLGLQAMVTVTGSYGDEMGRGDGRLADSKGMTDAVRR